MVDPMPQITRGAKEITKHTEEKNGTPLGKPSWYWLQVVQPRIENSGQMPVAVGEILPPVINKYHPNLEKRNSSHLLEHLEFRQ